MSRSLIAIVVLGCLLLGTVGYLVYHNAGHDGMRGGKLLSPVVVVLPYEEVHDKGGFHIKISAIPDVVDAVKIKVHASSFGTWESREWIQRGPGKIVLVLDGGKDKYILDVLELQSEEGSVKGVKISLESRWTEGPRKSLE
jgi:hypothetical protein